MTRAATVISFRRAAVLALALCSTATAALLATAAPALAETCPNEEFRTGLSGALPDCRAYELVTPPFKEATSAGPQATGWSFRGISTNGSRVVTDSLGDYGDAQQNEFPTTYLLTRTESGWSETSLDLPASQFVKGEIRSLAEPGNKGKGPVALTPEMDEALYADRTSEGAPLNVWLREADGALRQVGPLEPPPHTEGELVSWSADLSHVLIYSSASWPGDEAYGVAGGHLYDYATGREGPPVPVTVEPDGAPCAGSSGEVRDPAFPGSKGVSSDGSTVIFTCGKQIFARIDNGEAGAHTVAISEPSAADCSACDTSAGVRTEATYDGMSPDGSKVFFTTTQPLLGADTSANVYEYDLDAPQASPEDPDGRLIHVSGGAWGTGGAQVGSLVALSEDGSHVYFTSPGVLSGAVNDQGQAPVEGGENFYVFERDAQFPAGRLSFIATAQQGQEQEYDSTTPDGRFFVFASPSDLTPGDTSTAVQVFEYDAQTGVLVRCSIGQDGFNDNGNTDSFGVSIPFGRAVSDNGEYVAFESADGLTPGALNGLATTNTENGDTIYFENVYEYHDGSVYLISDGQDRSTVEDTSSVKVYGMSHGGDIFFTTADQLVPQDLDTEVDLYDARIGGGFPPPVSLLPSCQGDACQGPLTGAPVLLSPGSEFQAGGNPPLAQALPAAKPKAKAKTRAKGCKKGYAKGKGGRCVRKPRAKKIKARKASNDRRGASS